jgi:hypothetical protein
VNYQGPATPKNCSAWIDAVHEDPPPPKVLPRITRRPCESQSEDRRIPDSLKVLNEAEHSFNPSTSCRPVLFTQGYLDEAYSGGFKECSDFQKKASQDSQGTTLRVEDSLAFGPNLVEAYYTIEGGPRDGNQYTAILVNTNSGWKIGFIELDVAGDESAAASSSTEASSAPEVSSEGARAQITKCFTDAIGLPQAEVVMEGGDEKEFTYHATVAFIKAGEQYGDEFGVQLETPPPYNTAVTENTEETSAGLYSACKLMSLTHYEVIGGGEVEAVTVQGEGPEVPLE